MLSWHSRTLINFVTPSSHLRRLFSAPLDPLQPPTWCNLLSYPSTILKILNLNLLTLDHSTQRSFFHHQAHDLIQSICGRHRGVLRVCVIGRCNFDDVCSNKVDAFQTTDDRSEFTSRPTASLRGTGCGSD